MQKILGRDLRKVPIEHQTSVKITKNAEIITKSDKDFFSAEFHKSENLKASPKGPSKVLEMQLSVKNVLAKF